MPRSLWAALPLLIPSIAVGVDLEWNPDLARELSTELTQAIDRADADATCGLLDRIDRVGFVYLSGADAVGTPTEWGAVAQKLAERARGGDSGALYCLGYINWNGLGTERDGEKAERLFKRAADAGNDQALTSWAMAMFANGRAFPLEAVRQAAEQGNVEARSLLADTLVSPAQYKLEVQPSYVEALRLYEGVGEHIPAALCNRATALMLGLGVDPSPREAMDLYMRGMKLGHVNCLVRLASALVGSDPAAVAFRDANALPSEQPQRRALARNLLSILIDYERLAGGRVDPRWEKSLRWVKRANQESADQQATAYGASDLANALSSLEREIANVKRSSDPGCRAMASDYATQYADLNRLAQGASDSTFQGIKDAVIGVTASFRAAAAHCL